jgi:branched-chain amino acid transport system substrate-binding protein
MTGTRLRRRTVLAGAAALIASPAIVRAPNSYAQGAPIRIGSLTPLTGGGGSVGPSMRDAIVGVIAEVNQAGGVLGRQIQVVTEDDQTNPEAAVRAARKLIDVDGVIAITGTWASAVTTAVAPLCWENKVVLCTVSGADSITQLPHQGYIFRTQPTGVLQWPAVSRFMHREGGTRLAYMSPQTPFAQSAVDYIKEYARTNNLTFASLIYEDRKTSYRSEVDEIMRSRPDFIFMGGYQPDVTVLIRDIFRASYGGKLLAAAYAVNQQVVAGAPADVTNGIYLYEPWGAVESGGYRRVQRIVNRQEVDPYTAQTYDHASLIALAIQAAGTPTGQAVRDAWRRVSQGGGDAVDNAVDGLRLLREGKKIDYSGASGPCDFTDTGDISGALFRFQRIVNQRFETVRVE